MRFFSINQNPLKDLINHWTDPVIQRGATGTSLVVGVVLTLINKGFQPLTGPYSWGLGFQVGLTFLVPYFVSTFSAIRTRLRVQPDHTAPKDGIYRCESCLEDGIYHDVELKKGDPIPECNQAGSDGQFTLVDRSIA